MGFMLKRTVRWIAIRGSVLPWVGVSPYVGARSAIRGSYEDHLQDYLSE